MPFVTQRRVEFVDTDMAGIMHFSRFFLWMESVEVELMRLLGFSVVMPLDDRSLGFPRVSAQCTYLQPIRFEDLVDCAMCIERMGEKSITYAHRFSLQGNVVAQGSLVVCCTVKTDHGLRSTPIPDHIRQALQSSSAAVGFSKEGK